MSSQDFVREVYDASYRRLVDFAAASPDSRAVIWQYCGEVRSCNHQQFALTVADELFESGPDANSWAESPAR